MFRKECILAPIWSQVAFILNCLRFTDGVTAYWPVTNYPNRFWTIHAFLLVLVHLYRTFTCSFVLLLLKSNSDSHTFLFQSHIYLNFLSKTAFWYDFNMCVMNRRTDRKTDILTDQQTDTRSY